MRTILLSCLLLVLTGCSATRPGAPPPEAVASVRASTAPAAAVCGCHRRDLPNWVAWLLTHDAWTCTVILPRDQSVPAMPCSLWNTQPPVPTGFDVRVTP